MEPGSRFDPSLEKNDLQRSKAPHWLRCLRAIAFRIFLQKWRSPCSTSFELLIPLAFAFIFVCCRSFAKEFLMVRTFPETRYLSDYRYNYCPFGYYGPRIGWSDIRLAKNVTDTLGIDMEDIYCERIYNITIPTLLSLLLHGPPSSQFDFLKTSSRIDVSDTFGRWKRGFFKPMKSFSLTPASAHRRLNGFHMLHLAKSEYVPLQEDHYPLVEVLGESSLCNEFQQHVESLKIAIDPESILDRSRNRTSQFSGHPLWVQHIRIEPRKVYTADSYFNLPKPDHIVCTETHEKEGKKKIVFELHSKDRINFIGFPYDNKDFLYDHTNLVSVSPRSWITFLSDDFRNRDRLSKANFYMLVSSFFLNRIESAKGALSNDTTIPKDEIDQIIRFRPNEDHSNVTIYDNNITTFGIDRARRILPSEIALMKRYHANTIGQTVSTVLNANPSNLFQYFCYICHHHGVFYQHRPFDQCENFESFIEVTISQRAAKKWHQIITIPPENKHSDFPEIYPEETLFQKFTRGSCTLSNINQILPPSSDGNGIDVRETLKAFAEGVSGIEKENVVDHNYRRNGKSRNDKILIPDSEILENFSLSRKRSVGDTNAEPWVDDELLKTVINLLDSQIGPLPTAFQLVRERVVTLLRENANTETFREIFSQITRLWNRMIYPLYTIVLNNLITEWSLGVLEPTLKAAHVPEIAESSMPSKEAWWDRLGEIAAKSILPDILGLLLFLFPFISIIDVLMAEKESKMKEVLQIMGASEAMRYLSLYLFFGTWLGVLLILYTLITRTIFFSISMFVHFLLLWTFAFNLISFAVYLSSWFSRSKAAANIAPSIFIIQFFLYQSFDSNVTMRTVWQRLLAWFIFTPGPLVHGYRLLAVHQIGGAGSKEDTFLSFSRMFSTSMNGITIFECCLLNLFYGTFYFALGWYCNQVWPGETGVPRSWYFPIQSLFHKTIKFENQLSIDQDVTAQSVDPSRFEPLKLKGNPEPVLKARGLKKKFEKDGMTMFSERNYFYAVKGVDLDVYTGEIYALLGHNGAGKSTIINMMTGMIPPTAGSVWIDGYNLVEETSKARQHLGYCPQHDVIYDFMTVNEHLIMFSVIKGVAHQVIQKDIDEVLAILKISDKKHCRADTLSGGQKRRLSVAIALVGGSRVLFLDEPSTGMDPFTRRAFWDMLERVKVGRAIVLTTHSMEEADVLGSRIGIMAQGVMQCEGTSLFLKQIFGVGYTLSLTKSAEYTTLQEEALREAILSSITGASMSSNISLEICFRIPMHATHVLPDFLFDLENNQAKYGIQSFSMSLTTLEEVFLRVGAEMDDLGRNELDVANETEQANKRRSIANTAAALVVDSKRLSTKSEQEALLEVYAKPVKELEDSEDLLGEQSEKIDESGVSKNILERRETIHDLFQVAFQRKSGGTEIEISKKYKGSWGEHLLALMIKRFTKALRNPKMQLWRILEGPLAILVILFVMIHFQQTIKKSSIDPVAALAKYPSAKLLPQTLYFAFSSTVGTQFKKRYRAIMNSCNRSLWQPEYVDTVTTRSAMDELMFSKRQNINEERSSSFSRNYFSIFFDSDSKESEPYQVIMHDSAYAYAIEAGLIAFTDCVARYDNAVRRDREHMNFPDTKKNITELVRGKEQNDDTIETPNNFSISMHLVQIPVLKEKSFDLITAFIVSYLVTQYIGMLPAPSANFCLQEVESFAKRSQRLAGVSITAYWVVMWLWDLTTFSISTALLLAFVKVFDGQLMSTKQLALETTLATFAFGFSAIPLVYLTSFVITKESIIQGTFRTVGCFSPILFSIPILFKWLWPAAYKVVGYLLPIIPHISLSNALVASNVVAMLGDRNPLLSFLTIPEFHLSSIYMMCSGIGFMAFVILVDTINSDAVYKSYLRNIFCSCLRRQFSLAKKEEDMDVKLEREILQEQAALRISANKGKDHAKSPLLNGMEIERLLPDEQETNTPHDIEEQHFLHTKKPPLLVLEGLTKEYKPFLAKLGLGGQKKLAVNDLWFSVPSRQCFGFLGVNGCGKTTTIQMLTGCLLPTSGTARFNGADMLTSKSTPSIGYCPQFDALFEGMTGREHFYFYGRVAGVRESRLASFADSIMDALGIKCYGDRCVEHYSGGNRRKLAVGLAFIRSPEIVFLDEPSSGVDPVSRRKLWTIISQAARQGDRAVVLTTHMMEECEALCDRLTIMKDGGLLCLGTPSRLKSRFGRHFTFYVTLSMPVFPEVFAEEDPQMEEKLEELIEERVSQFTINIKELFSDIKLLERVALHMRWSIPKSTEMRLSMIFRLVESKKVCFGVSGHQKADYLFFIQTEWSIDSYGVSDASLESIFVEFQKDSSLTSIS